MAEQVPVALGGIIPRSILLLYVNLLVVPLIPEPGLVAWIHCGN